MSTNLFLLILYNHKNIYSNIWKLVLLCVPELVPQITGGAIFPGAVTENYKKRNCNL